MGSTENVLAGAEAREFGKAPEDAPEPTIDDMLSELGDIESDLEELSTRVWDHVPHLDECETPINDAAAGLGALRVYLEARKKELEGS